MLLFPPLPLFILNKNNCWYENRHRERWRGCLTHRDLALAVWETLHRRQLALLLGSIEEVWREREINKVESITVNRIVRPSLTAFSQRRNRNRVSFEILHPVTKQKGDENTVFGLKSNS